MNDEAAYRIPIEWISEGQVRELNRLGQSVGAAAASINEGARQTLIQHERMLRLEDQLARQRAANQAGSGSNRLADMMLGSALGAGRGRAGMFSDTRQKVFAPRVTSGPRQPVGNYNMNPNAGQTARGQATASRSPGMRDWNDMHPVLGFGNRPDKSVRRTGVSGTDNPFGLPRGGEPTFQLSETSRSALRRKYRRLPHEAGDDGDLDHTPLGSSRLVLNFTEEWKKLEMKKLERKKLEMKKLGLKDSKRLFGTDE